jgi:hypothetical protein
MIVVSDTGPLFYLTLIGISEQLPYIFMDRFTSLGQYFLNSNTIIHQSLIGK